MSSWHKKILIAAFIVSGAIHSFCYAQDMSPHNFINNSIEIPADEKKPVEPKKIRKKQVEKKTQNPSDKVEIISDFMDYFPAEDKLVATGNASVTPEDKLSKLKADKITFYRDTNIIIAEGNVKILKDDAVVVGSYVRVDLNKNTSVMYSPRTEYRKIKIVAKEGYVYSNNIELLKGRMKLPTDDSFVLTAGTVKSAFADLDQKEMLKYSKSPEYQSKDKIYKIRTKEILIESGKDRNLATMKNATIYKNQKKIAKSSNMALSGNESFSEIDTTLPEFGYIRQLGLNIGPSYLMNGPKNSTLKLSPLLVANEGRYGIGGLARMRTDNNMTQISYGTPMSKVIISGVQKFEDPRFKFNYGSNAFIDDGFMGRKMPSKIGEIDFRDSVDIKDLGLTYKYRYSAAIASDYTVGDSSDARMNSSEAIKNLPYHKQDWGTLKLKTQGEFFKTKPIWERKDLMEFNTRAQYDFNQYGTGQNYTVVRIGPTFRYTPGKFKFMTSYFLSGSHGQSPFTWDQYYYGKQTLNTAYEYKFTPKMTLGFSNSLNLLKDNFDGTFVVENRWYVKYGPDDFKFCFSYDTVRQQSIVGVDMLVGADNSDIEFDKLKIKDYKNFQKQQDEKKRLEAKRNKKKEEKV